MLFPQLLFFFCWIVSVGSVGRWGWVCRRVPQVASFPPSLRRLNPSFHSHQFIQPICQWLNINRHIWQRLWLLLRSRDQCVGSRKLINESGNVFSRWWYAASDQLSTSSGFIDYFRFPTRNRLGNKLETRKKHNKIIISNISNKMMESEFEFHSSGL